MRLSVISLVPLALPALLLSTSVSALPSHIVKLSARAPEDWDLSKTPYLGKGPVNTRSPCPMLNALANHGILPFNGRDITSEKLNNVLVSLGVTQETATLIVGGAFKIVGRETSSGTVLDLPALQAHNKIEHDVSLSRQDYGVTGDDATLNVTLIRQVELFLKDEAGSKYLDSQSLADARKLRLLQATRDNPTLDFSAKKVAIASAESAITLDIIGRNGHCSRENFESFFLHERFPETWKPVSPPIDAAQIKKRATEVGSLMQSSQVTLDWEKKPLPNISQ